MDKPRLGCFNTSGLMAAVLTILIVAGFGFATGGMLFSPGALNAQKGSQLGGVSSHAEIAGQCNLCHAPFWGSATMADRCMDCHTDVAAQRQDPVTLHGAFRQNNPNLGCRNCHPDHRGPNAPLTTVDHNLFAFKLTGQHGNVACTGCHINNVFKGTPTDCYSCHQKDDKHIGSYGTNCGACHTPNGWLPASFDHNLSAFKLDGQHVNVACENCHINNVFKGTPTDCNSCHQKDDKHKGQFGQNCAACHTTAGWLPANIDHNLFSFKLTGKHTTVVCESCHLNYVFRDTPTDCYSCHQKDDKHKGQFGTNCGSCHTTAGWLPATFDHNLSGFPLTGAHTSLNCTQCHTGGGYSGLSTACAACHAEPSVHVGMFGTDCAQCHTTSNWNATFNHPGGCDGNCANHQHAACTDCHTVNYSTATCSKCHDSNNPGGGD
jgi:hypothetical protein